MTALVISSLVMTEALVLPYRLKDYALICRYQLFFANCKILPLTENVFINAAKMRADRKRYGVRSFYLHLCK